MAMHPSERFMGFADIYEEARPRVPEYPAELLCRYLGHRPQTVVDLGCGTGLSTAVWERYADRVIGIEPSGDMLAVAGGKANGVLTFQQGTGEATGLPDWTAELVVCSQAFHWMEPAAALREVNRILKPGGIFAAVDYDWPPVMNWRVEQAFHQLRGKIREVEASLPGAPDAGVRRPKDRHLANIRDSGYFAYTREVLFSHEEPCTRERLKRMMLSQSGVQAILRTCPDCIRGELEAFAGAVEAGYGDDGFEITLCYRMRVGIKP